MTDPRIAVLTRLERSCEDAREEESDGGARYTIGRKTAALFKLDDVEALVALAKLTSALPPAQEVSTLDDADLAIVEFIDEHSVGCETVTMPTSHWERLSAFLRSRPPVKQEPDSQWRKIDHRDATTYPKSGKGVLFVVKDRRSVVCGAYEASLGGWFSEVDEDHGIACDKVTHWQPLPALPGEPVKQEPAQEVVERVAKAIALARDSDAYDECRTSEEEDAVLARIAIQAMGEATRTGEALGMARELYGLLTSAAQRAECRRLVVLLERETAGGR